MLENKLIDFPQEYAQNECDEKGKVERIDYMSLYADGSEMPKYAFVYTPYGYDETKEYEIMYLIHGGGENAEKYLYQGGEENPLKRALDHLVKNGEIKPTIVVTPSWYPFNDMTKNDGLHWTEKFPRELMENLMPSVESKYHTFAKTADDEGFKASREHRSVVGWSMGSVTTFFVMSKCIAYFNRFGNMSGDVELNGNHFNREPVIEENAVKAVDALAECIRNQGYGPDAYSIYFITGTDDFMLPRIAPQVEQMKKYPELFKFEGEDQNISYMLCQGGEHHTPWRLQYSFNVIKNYL